MGITKYVETSHLPHKNDSIIDWKKSVGYRCSFIYGEITGEIEIIDYIRGDGDPKIKVKYNNYEKTMSTSSFKHGVIGELLKIYTSDFRYNIGDILHQKNQDLKILDRWYVKEDGRNRKYYKYKCLNCGHENSTIEIILKGGCGCPVCNNMIVASGINDITVTDPWMIDYFPGGYDEAKQYTSGSTTKIMFKCPCCGKSTNKYKTISGLHQSHKCGCQCEKHMSFPEQVIYNLLEQFNIKFTHSCTKLDYPWINNFRYDFYLPDYNLIIETHGLQHYEDTLGFTKGKSLQRQQKIDKEKRELALSNNIHNYFEIDCRMSTVDWILNSCSESGLLKILSIDIANIDINNLYSIVYKSKINLCKELYEANPHITKTELSRKLRITSSNAMNYILKTLNISINGTKKPVALYDNNKFIRTFESIKEAAISSIGKPYQATSITISKYIKTGKLFCSRYEYRYI